MTNEQSSIEYPTEIHRLLKLGGTSHESTATPFILPQVEPEPESKEHVEELDHNLLVETAPKKAINWKALIVYPAVFLVAFFFFYTLFNFSALFAQFQSWFIKPQEEVILGNDQLAYYNWIQGYYFTVNDTKLLDPHNDIDRDGLSNMDEFAMHTNTTLPDSDSDGFSDG